MFIPTRRLPVLLEVLLLVLVVTGPLRGQTALTERPTSSVFGTGSSMLDETERNPLTGRTVDDLRDPRLRDRLDVAEVGRLAEGAIDPDRYMVGPGDRFLFLVTGPTEVEAPVAVDPEGRLYLPYVGVVDVGGQSLTEARARVEEAAMTVYSNVTLDLVLIALREFKVHVTGAVHLPGSYPATAVTRVSELVEMAGGVLEGASLRRVELLRGDEPVYVDLAGFALGGRLDRNPTVTDGEVVRVPVRVHTVYVSGAVENPGAYDPLPGERLSSLIDALGGLAGNVDSTAVLRSSFTTPTETVETTFAFVPGGGDAHDPVVADGDRFFFRERPDFLRSAEVFVYGAVKFPGRYPIPVEGASLRDVIARSGGITARANLAAAHVQRPIERFVARRGTVVATDDIFDRELVDEQRADLDADSAFVAVDFPAVFAGEAPPVIVRDGDIVHIPEDRYEVRVLGKVKAPGVYPYDPERSVSSYIDLAGGYDKDADKGRTRMGRFAGAPMARAGGGDDVSSGAVIYVPANERKSFMERLRETTGVVAGVASLVVLVDRLTE